MLGYSFFCCFCFVLFFKVKISIFFILFLFRYIRLRFFKVKISNSLAYTKFCLFVYIILFFWERTYKSTQMQELGMLVLSSNDIINSHKSTQVYMVLNLCGPYNIFPEGVENQRIEWKLMSVQAG